MEDIFKEVIEAYLKHDKNKTKAAKSLNMPRTTFRRILKKSEKNSDVKKVLKTNKIVIDEKLILQSEIKELKRELSKSVKDTISAEKIKKFIYEIKDCDPILPGWLKRSYDEDGITGVPSLALSDWHFGEVVDEKQVFYSNKYNLEIASERVQRIIDGAIDLAFNHIANPKYPGIVVPLLGDFQSGAIHEELKITAEKDVLQVELELLGVMIEAFKKLIEAFGKVFVPCVSGNHGRLTMKPKSKGYAYDTLDFHLYCLLAKFFENDDRIKFVISDGEDSQYKIYDWTYRITHGSQFKGGAGLAGALIPLAHGDLKKRKQARSMGNEYDFLVCGHFHQTFFLGQTIICNSSIVGMSEYAFKGLFQQERPSQSFWITHPENGITFQLPVFADDIKDKSLERKWAGWEE